MSHLNSEQLSICSLALRAACDELGPLPQNVRADMAVRILASANAGERDFARLKEIAITCRLAA